MSKNSNKGYTFTIQNGAVTGVSEIKNGRAKFEKMDADEVWSYDANTNQVIKTEMDHGRVETTVYTDANSDGVFSKASKSTTGSVAHTPDQSHTSDLAHTSGDDISHSSQQEGYQFTIIDGAVAAIFETEHGYTKAKTLEFGESWSVVGDQVVKTEVEHGVTETSVYADSNADGIFNKISKSYSNDAYSKDGTYGGSYDNDASEHHIALTGATSLTSDAFTF